MQGYRVSMEDRHNTIADVDKYLENNEKLKQILDQSGTKLSFFGVYDGHSGDSCADFLSKHLCKTVMQFYIDSQSNNDLLQDDETIRKGFLFTDILFEEQSIRNGKENAPYERPKTESGYSGNQPNDDSGTTAVTVFVKKHNNSIEIICANTGDSRCVFYLDREGKTIPLSFDHKPMNTEERKRIRNSGGYVEFGRVNGTLAVSRAFGDLIYKTNTKIPQREQAVSALPDIKREVLHLSSQNEEYNFVVLACDGVWDVMSNEDVTKYVRDKLAKQKSGEYWTWKQSQYQQALALYNQNPSNFSAKPECKTRPQQSCYDLGSICEDLLDHCVKELDSKDNVSVVIVLFK